jgi:hypothetical protein
MTDDDLRQIAARCELATAGPWRSWIEGRDHTSGSSFIATTGEDIEMVATNAADQDFMAAARQDVPSLLAEVIRLRALLAAKGSG